MIAKIEWQSFSTPNHFFFFAAGSLAFPFGFTGLIILSLLKSLTFDSSSSLSDSTSGATSSSYNISIITSMKEETYLKDLLIIRCRTLIWNLLGSCKHISLVESNRVIPLIIPVIVSLSTQMSRQGTHCRVKADLVAVGIFFRINSSFIVSTPSSTKASQSSLPR